MNNLLPNVLSRREDLAGQKSTVPIMNTTRIPVRDGTAFRQRVPSIPTRWHTSRKQPPPWMKRSKEATPSSQDSSLSVQNSPAVYSSLQVQRELKALQKLASRLSSESSNLFFYDMNELPYISHMRSLLLIVCSIAFFVAPGAYMPLGTIQANYDQKCFLYTDVALKIIDVQSDNSTTPIRKIIALDSVLTNWCPTDTCHFATYTPVSIAIFSVIIGWSTLTIWPTMMSLGKGGVLMLLYTTLAIMCLVVCIVSTLELRNGYRHTCDSMLEFSDTIPKQELTCVHLNNVDIHISEVNNSQMVRNIHKAMFTAEAVGWCLAGLAITEVLICMTTFLIIWFHFHLTPDDGYWESEEDMSDTYDDDFSSEKTGSTNW